MNFHNQRVLELLSQRFPTIAAATSEIINLNAILQLPKGTEHFISDLHGEYEAFCHILRNASGVIRIKIDEIFLDSLTDGEKNALATLVYYPKQRLSYLKKQGDLSDDWYYKTLSELIRLCRGVASKYTRSKVRKALPPEFAYIIEELLHGEYDSKDKDHYYRCITETILETARGDAFLVAISQLIQRLAVDRLHILGDIFDRGPGPHVILDTLMKHHSVDIAWGNHDILWMGAAAGNFACIFSVIRICARYDHLETLETGYAVSLRQLISFADSTYREDPCSSFYPKSEHIVPDGTETKSVARLQKAAAVLQFKAEYDIIRRHPEYEMEHRLLLSCIHPQTRTLVVDQTAYPLTDCVFPTVDWNHPYRFTAEEKELCDRLRDSFTHSVRLQEHVRFLLSKGGMYQIENENLMYHGCIPMTEEGEFAVFLGHKGKALLDYFNTAVHKGIMLEEDSPEKEAYRDCFWYLWCGKHSPLFGKEKMATFERYFTPDSHLWQEKKNPYYQLLEGEHGKAHAETILKEFGLTSPNAHLINGHVPVQQIRGESPVKAGGKLFVIDGGLSRAYQAKTGIAGYTLLYNSHGYLLTSHQPFSSTEEAVTKETDIISHPVASASSRGRLLVKDTDTGKLLIAQIEELKALTRAYRKGEQTER